MKIGFCRLCGRDRIPLVKAHVIARSFFHALRGHEKYVIQMRATRESLENEYFQAGVADPNILCEECERRFTVWDTCGFQVLSQPLTNPILSSDGRNTPLAAPIHDLDYANFALFVLSVLWRASVSKAAFFKTVSLGPFERRIRDLLWNNRSPDPAEYAIVIATCLDEPYAHSILRPELVRDHESSFKYYRLYFPRRFIFVKADSRQAKPLQLQCMIQPRPINFVFCYPPSNSPYTPFFEGMREAVRQSRRAKQV
jgi:hypothetical protein